RHTRRFSPFAVLGLRPNVAGGEAVPHEAPEESNPPTHTGVGVTHPHEPPTSLGGDSPHLPREGIHTTVEVKKNLTTTVNDPREWEVPPPHRGEGAPHPHDPPTRVKVDQIPLAQVDVPPAPAVPRDTLGLSASTDVRIQDVIAATQVRTQLGK